MIPANVILFPQMINTTTSSRSGVVSNVSPEFVRSATAAAKSFSQDIMRLRQTVGSIQLECIEDGLLCTPNQVSAARAVMQSPPSVPDAAVVDAICGPVGAEKLLEKEAKFSVIQRDFLSIMLVAESELLTLKAGYPNDYKASIVHCNLFASPDFLGLFHAVSSLSRLLAPLNPLPYMPNELAHAAGRIAGRYSSNNATASAFRHTVIVTGGGKGIGKGIVEAFSMAGAHVVTISRSKEDLDNLQKLLGYGKITCIQGDCTLTADIEKTIAAALLRGGDTVHLVNNVGVAICKPFLNLTESDYDCTMNVNVKAAFITTQIFARKLLERAGTQSVKSCIVNVSSQASEQAFPDHAAYCISKAAMNMLTKTTALELGPRGFRCNSVNPTVVLTDMGKANWGDPEKGRPMISRIPLGRFAEVCEVTDAVMFLVSDSASMITGSALPVEGGLLSTCTLK